MTQDIKAPISVNLIYNHRKSLALPRFVQWDGEIYKITKLGLHHTYRNGRTLYHVFSVSSGNLFFRLVLNTDNLFWTLEELSDGQPD